MVSLVLAVEYLLPHRIGDLEIADTMTKLVTLLPHRIGDLEIPKIEVTLVSSLHHRIGRQ